MNRFCDARLPAPTAPRDRRASAVLLAGLVGFGTLVAGCADTLERGRGSNSLLALMQDDTYGDSATDAMNPYDADKRYRGTLRLANANFASEPLYMQLFLDNVKDQDASVRAAATRAIANHGTPEHVPILIERLRDTDNMVRGEAARGLQRLHNPIAIVPLIDAMRDAENAAPNEPSEELASIRADAAWALGQYPEDRVVQSLITGLADSSLAVNRASLDSLRTLTGQDFGLDRAKWLAWYKQSSAPFAAGRAFEYPVFQRDKEWYEYLPFVSPPPNEPKATPAGLPMERPSGPAPTAAATPPAATPAPPVPAASGK